MNERKFNHVFAQLQSWESGYISPSAQMVMKDARALITEMFEEIIDLKIEIDLLKNPAKVSESKDIEF